MTDHILKKKYEIGEPRLCSGRIKSTAIEAIKVLVSSDTAIFPYTVEEMRALQYPLNVKVRRVYEAWLKDQRDKDKREMKHVGVIQDRKKRIKLGKCIACADMAIPGRSSCAYHEYRKRQYSKLYSGRTKDKILTKSEFYHEDTKKICPMCDKKFELMFSRKMKCCSSKCSDMYHKMMYTVKRRVTKDGPLTEYHIELIKLWYQFRADVMDYDSYKEKYNKLWDKLEAEHETR
jgi:hypothetical protein